MTTGIRTIVAAIDEVKEAPHLTHAIALAEALGATLHVVHGYDLPDPSLYPNLELSVFSPDVLDQVQDRAQRMLEEDVAGITKSDRVRCHAYPGTPALAVLGVADSVAADLIVVGASRRGMIARAVLGTTAQRVIRNATVPVLVTGRPGGGFGRVLLTTDLSPISTKVFDRGVEMAGLLSGVEAAELRAVLVVGYDQPMIMPIEPGGAAEGAERRLGEFLEGRQARTGTVVRGRVRVGEPAREILDEADEWDADLLVLGTHGRGGALRFLIGSVAESVLRRVDIDVLVVPTAAVAEPGDTGDP